MSRQFDAVLLGSIELFCLAAELNSFTAAATAAGISPAAVSRSMARLEARLGVRLFNRSTRHVRLTEAGQRYEQQCRQALSQLLDAERELSGAQQTPRGRLRISLPTSYGHLRVLPLIGKFSARYPDVEMDVQISNHSVNFHDDGFDLAVRARAPEDGTLVARLLERSPLVVVGAPDYFFRKGRPQTPDDLQHHTCIRFIRPLTGRKMPWEFTVAGRHADIETDSRFCVSDDVIGCVSLARHGVGLCQIHEFLVADDLRNGTLEEVLTPWRGPERSFTLVWPQNRQLPLRTRVFIDFLLEETARWRHTAAPSL